MKAAIVIPVYKPIPDAAEQMSLDQTAAIFKGEAIFFVGPATLDYSYYQTKIAESTIIQFEDTYFGSIQGYNRLLLSTKFYKAFEAFGYILITQLDVWVFSNQLQHWCDKGYDYIGAPWLERPPLQKKINLLPMGKWMYRKVGNGGFSLRKVGTHTYISSKMKSISWLFNKNEDFFWSIVAPKIFRWFKIPALEEAVFFAFEIAPAQAYELTGHQLPFGVHAWQKHQPEFWKNLIPLSENQQK